MADEGRRALDMFVSFGVLARQAIRRNPRQSMAVPCKELAEAMDEVSRIRSKLESMLETYGDIPESFDIGAGAIAEDVREALGE